MLATLKRLLLVGDHVCPWWLAYSFDNPLRRLLHDPETLLDGLVDPGNVVLDLGCGMGHFSLGLAGLVGEEGLVYAADIQREMLDIVERRANRAGLKERIRTHLAKPERVGLDRPLDFVLLFWVAHEVRDQAGLFEELTAHLKNGARLLLAEPRIHVRRKDFQKTVELAVDAGLRLVSQPPVRISRSALFQK